MAATGVHGADGEQSPGSGEGRVQDDLSALSWVQEELRRSLELAHKALRRYLKEAGSGGDLDMVDPSVLRQARAALHQSVGVLEVVGLGTPIELLRAAEAALQRLSAKPRLINAKAVEAIEHGSFALLDYIARHLAGKPVSPLALFPQYKALQELAGATRIHPADLWSVPWRWVPLAPEAGMAARHPDAPTVALIESDLLALMRGAPPSVAARMSEVFAGLAVGVRQAAPGDLSHQRLATLWQLAAAFFEAQADGLLAGDVHSKRVGSQLLRQLRAGEDGEAAQRLAHDLLYFCSQAAPRSGVPMLGTGGRRLAAVRAAWALPDEPPVDIEQARLGRFDPAWIAQARKRVASAKEVWSAVAGGDLARLAGLQEQFALVADSLQRLYPDGAVLGRALQVAVAQTTAANAEPSAELAMEVATALLYVDASLDDADFDHPDTAPRIQRLAQRVEQVRQQRDPGTLELWMEELYRRVSDRQTMGSVVAELRASLSEVEKNIDQYFRDPSQRQVLVPVPGQLGAMRGVLSVLGLDQASQAVLRMRDDVAALAETEVDPQRAIASGAFDRLADNLGALSFLIDMVAVQPQMAKSLFRFDPVSGNLSAVMAREDRPSGYAELDGRDGAETLPPGGQDTDALAVTLEFDRMVKQARVSHRAAHPEAAGQALPLLHLDDPLTEQPTMRLPRSDDRTLQLSLHDEDDDRTLQLPRDATLTVRLEPDDDDERTLQLPPRTPPHEDFRDPRPDRRPGQGLPSLAEDDDERTLRLERSPVPPPMPTAVLTATPISTPVAAPAATPTAAPAGTGLEDDPEMREIFLEEAREVLDAAAEGLDALQQRHDDNAAMTSVRRAFHTLKGSARMVGLTAFGEAAWACEQLYNTRLAEHQGADQDLREFSREVLAQFALWVDALNAGDASAFDPAHIAVPADALRTERRRLPLGGTVVPAAEAPDDTVTVRAEAPLAVPSTLEVGESWPDAVEMAPVAPVAEPAEASAPALPVAQEVQELPQLSELDLADFGEAFASSPSPSPSPVPSQAPSDEPVVSASSSPVASSGTVSLLQRVPDLPLASDLDLDWIPELDEVEPPAPAPAPGLAAVAAEPVPLPELSINLADLDEAPAEPPPAAYEATQLFRGPAPDATLPLPVPGAPTDLLLDLDDADGAAHPVDPSLGSSLGSSVPELPTLAADLDLDFAAAATDLPLPAPAEAPAPAAAAVDERDDDAIKQIGPLRIAIPLFNIYLGEADELSRRLGIELAEWSLELHRPVGDTAIALAHSLAGSSATVGFADLSQLARALEHALERVQARGRGHADESALFSRCADEIRRLLHLFAAGFLQAPDADLLPLLQHIIHAAPEPQVDGDVVTVIAGLDAEPAQIDAAEAPASPDERIEPAEFAESAESVEPAELSEPAGPAELAEAPEAANSVEPVEAPRLLATGELGRAAVLPFTALDEAAPRAPAGVARAADALDIGDEIDAIDQLDEDLFPVFVDEALELLPQIHARLREWSAKVGDPSAGSACMRALHTLKGGSRLAGAMRLGEMAHRLESAVERLLAAGSATTAADLEPLVHYADALEAQFDVLRGVRSADEAGDAGASATPGLQALPQEPVQQRLHQPVQPTVSEPAQETVESVSAPALESLQSVAPPVATSTTTPTTTPTAAPVGQAEPAPAVAPAPAPAPAPAVPVAAAPPARIDWQRFRTAQAPQPVQPERSAAHAAAQASVRVRAPLLDRLVNQAGEVSFSRTRIETDVRQLKGAMVDLHENLERLRSQLRDIELQAETQIGSRMEAARVAAQQFDPLEMDRFTRFQELTRMMAESVSDVATVQRGLQRTLQSAEDALAHQARMTRDMQDDLLRTRMVEFDSLSERLYRVVRQAAKETAKPVRLDIVGASIEVDRGVLERITPAFEHLLRNSVVHGIESAERRAAAGKPATGTVTVAVSQLGNEVAVEVRDDGAGLDLARIAERGRALGLIAADAQPDEAELANLVFQPGFTTASEVTDLAGRGVGMDVVRTEVNAMGGRIETATAAGQGASFRVVLPLTTAVTQVVMLRCGERTVAVPSTLVETVRRLPRAEAEQAYERGAAQHAGRELPYFWLDALLQGSPAGALSERSAAVLVVRSADQRIVLHVDEVMGNQEVVIKHLGPQLSRLPGLVGMTLLPSGLPALIYNPVALATMYGDAARLQAAEAQRAERQRAATEPSPRAAVLAPLVLVVDDSLTVRRVTQRLLEREGYRVALAKDGMEGLEKLGGERPAVLLSDIEMPRMDGFDLVRNLRADARLADLPVIMITSRIAQKHRDHAAGLGVNHYLGKPYAEDELLALVARYARTGLGLPSLSMAT